MLLKKFADFAQFGMSPSHVKQVVVIAGSKSEFTIALALHFPNAHIDAFEPYPEHYNTCKHMVSELNSDQRKRIHVHELALNDEKGKVPYFYTLPPSEPAYLVGTAISPANHTLGPFFASG